MQRKISSYEIKGYKPIRITEIAADFVHGIYPQWFPIVKDTRICCHYHLHEDLEFILVLEGSITFQVNGVQHDVSANDVLLINPFEAHSGSVTSDCKKVLYYAFNLNPSPLKNFPSPLLQDLLSKLIQGEAFFQNRFSDPKEREELIDCLKSILQYYNVEDNEFYQLSSLFRLFALLGKPILFDGVKGGKRSTEFIKTVILYIQNTDPQEISLDSIAKIFSYNKAYFTTLFRKNFGMSFVDFIIKYKIEMAKEHIRNGNYNLNEVATKSGFNFYTYFFRKFKLITGVSPSDFVDQCRANHTPPSHQK